MASELKWKTVDPARELSPEMLRAFERSKEAYKEYQAAKQRFEDMFKASVASQIPPGFEIKFGYNYGKLSVAIAQTDPSKERKAAAKPKESLADWMQAQTSGGFAS